ncbi:MAG: DUF456 domain-containing protein [Syntrophomonadaceae bacterium]
MITTNTLVLIIVIILMLVGIAGIIFPVLPGSGLIFIAIAAYGWYEGFQVITGKYLVVMGALTVLAMTLSYLSTVWGAKYTGAGKAGTWGALLGLLVGLFILPPAGMVLGPWIGAFIGEFIANKDAKKALLAGVGAVLGLFSGMLIHLIIALIMVGTFLYRVF